MHFHTPLSLLPLLTLVLSSPLALPKRSINTTTATVLTDLNTLTSDASLLSSDLASFLNGTSTIKPFSRHFSSFTRLIKTTISDTEAVGSFDEEDSQAVAQGTADWAQSTLNLLISLMDNASAVIAKGEKAEVLDDLNAANSAQIDLFAALEGAVDLESFSSVSTSQNELMFAFQDAVKDYS